MKVYFYHTQDVCRILGEWREWRFPGHFLYGATRLGGLGIEVTWHSHFTGYRRWRAMFRTAREVLSRGGKVDAVFATHYQGLELVILLRALGLFRKPIVVWMHQPMGASGSVARRLLARVFYRGIDRMLFFSRTILEQSLCSPAAIPQRMGIGRWGADTDYYDRLMQSEGRSGRGGFVSTGKELRDIPTLVEAASATDAEVDIYLPDNFSVDGHGVTRHSLERKYGKILKGNVRITYVRGLIPYELSKIVNRAACVVVCCYETNYTAGLTTVVEAMALGLPVICSRNPNMPMSPERDGFGISVDYGDVDGWRRAIEWVAAHPAEAKAMGERARRLAETTYNDRNCALDVAAALREVAGRKAGGN